MATFQRSMMEDDMTNATGHACSIKSSSAAANFSIMFFDVVVILLTCKGFNFALRYIGQPKIVSDFMVGMLLGNYSPLTAVLDAGTVRLLNLLPKVTFSGYMFVLGLEMEPISMLTSRGPEVTIALTSVVSSLAVSLICYPILYSKALHFVDERAFHAVASIMVALATTASPILTRLTTDLKIGKSEVGRLAVRAGLISDMVPTILMCIGICLAGHETENDKNSLDVNLLNYYFTQGQKVTHEKGYDKGITIIMLLLVQALVIAKVFRPIFVWLNDQNPEGRQLKGLDVVAAGLMVAGLSFSMTILGFNLEMNAFLVGLALPRHGRVSNFLISNINFLLSAFLLPFYSVMVGTNVKWKVLVNAGLGLSLAKMAIAAMIGTVGKVSGTLIAGSFHGLQLNEAGALGLLLNVKGYYHIICANVAMRIQLIDEPTFIEFVFVIMGTIVYIPVVVAFIVRWARQRAAHQRMGLQWIDISSELRIVMGLHSPDNVAMAINVMEAVRGGGGVVAYVMDMVELTDRAAATLVQGKGVDAVTVTDEAVVEMRDQIGAALQAYVGEGGDGVSVRRLLAVSEFSDMHVDICNGAEDVRAEMIILPFHKKRRVDGGLDGGHPGFRLVNQKVLRHATCSVGIMVDRGLTWGNRISLSEACVNVAAVFIGGADDREALAYAARIAQHPGIRLAVIRFLLDAGDQQAPARRRGGGMVVRQGAEMRADDQYFAGFYERHVAGGRGVDYTEKHVASGVEAVSVLRAVEGQYQLFVVGRGRERDSTLTSGMEEWAECPELGAIGDILAASEFSGTTSVLVIQQHDFKKALNLIDADFAPI